MQEQELKAGQMPRKAAAGTTRRITAHSSRWRHVCLAFGLARGGRRSRSILPSPATVR